MEIKQEHRDFIEANIHHFDTIDHGYLDNLDIGKMNKYEDIYHTYLSGSFFLTKWCSGCVFTMMTRLKKWWEENK